MAHSNAHGSQEVLLFILIIMCVYLSHKNTEFR